MQFTAIVLMIGLALKLFLLPRRVEENGVTGRSRWLMLGGTAVVGTQFFLQFMLGLRAMGVTQAVVLNLAMFPLASWLMSLSVLYLQKQGRVGRADKCLGGAVWLTVLALMGVAVAVSGKPLLSDTPQMQRAEEVGGVLYFLMQCHYFAKHVVGLRKIHQSLANYYDHDMSHLLRWMQISICVLAVLALFVPALIFVPGRWLAVFAIVFFYGTWYLVDSFCDYVKSSMPKKVEEAEKSEEGIVKSEKFAAAVETMPEKTGEHEESAEADTSEAMLRVEAAIGKWVEQGGHRKSGLNKSMVAEQTGVPFYLLGRWLRQQNLRFNDWMTDLRIDEAKRVIREHPGWTNEAVADYCGFTDRTALQRKFKEKTGKTPTEYSEQNP